MYFLHYQSFKSGIENWERRAKRIHWDNLFIVLSEKDGCTMADLEEFDHMSFNNKVAFTHTEYTSLTNGCYIKGYEASQELGNIMDFNGFWGAKVYDQFDWVKFLNQKG